MDELDQTARYALKMAPAESLSWLVPDLDPDLAFRRWLDTETIAFPGEPKRRCDTVAELVSRGGSSPPWALVLEVEARLRSTILDRLLEYQLRVMRKLRHGPHRRDRYQVAGMLVLLRGKKGDLELHVRLPGTNIGLDWTARTLSLSQQQAATTLERIGRGELGKSVLPWVPLMAGGGVAAAVQEWVRLAGEETSAERRRDYAGLARVFAERAGCLPAWERALEGFDMWQSQVIKEWKDEGRKEGRQEGQREAMQAALLQVLRRRFKEEPPQALAQLIQQTTNLETLSRWTDHAWEVASLEEFRTRIQAPQGN